MGSARVHPKSCPGPLPGKSLVGLTCSAYSAVRGGRSSSSARSNFIDGGVPGQRAGGAGRRAGRGLLLKPRTLRPLTVLLRQSQHPTAAGGTSACAGENRPGIQRRGADGQRPREHRPRAGGSPRRIVSRHWNLTTRALLLPELHRRSPPTHPSSLSSKAGRRRPGAEPAAPAWRPAGRELQPLGRFFISRCLRRRPLGGAELEACAATVQGKGGNVLAGLDAGARAQGAAPLSPDEVLRYAE